MNKHYFTPPKNQNFIGRIREKDLLTEIHNKKSSSIIVIQGRRRVGKTELIEQFFRKDRLLKFEGIQIPPPKQNQLNAARQMQINHCLDILARYKNDPLLPKLSISRWYHFFELLTDIVTNEPVILYFEETQWLAAYQSDFFAEMKPLWDDYWRHNKKLRVIFSGSSPSFLRKQFLSDKALYNRSQQTISLDPFSPEEIGQYLSQFGAREKLFASLCVGGIPEYLRIIKEAPSLTLGIARNAFRKDAPFVLEYEKIFVSSLSQSKHYQRVLELLAQHTFLTRNEIVKKTQKNAKDGGSFTNILEDLEQSGFIEAYQPIHRPHGTNLRRYRISDEYIWFYQNFIKPKLPQIKKGLYDKNPAQLFSTHSFITALGFSFERWCIKNERLIARICGFDTIDYEVGSYFSRRSEKIKKGYQIDLMYIRRDHTIVVAECKYHTSPVGLDAIRSMDEKIALFLEEHTTYKNHTLQKILITPEGVTKQIQEGIDVSKVITLKDLFGAKVRK